VAGSAKLDDRIWKELVKKVGRLKDAHVKVGVLASAGGAAMAGDGDITLVELAAIHEFGSPAAGIPERSFIRSTFRRGDVVEAMNKLLTANARAIIGDKMSVSTALERLGAWGSAAVKGTIRERLTEGPEDQSNKPATIARKGSSTPLVDHGQLINSITYVKSEGSE
jgi:phage gpG-like protein